MQDWIIQVLCALLVLVLLTVAYHYAPTRTHNKVWIPHVVTIAVWLLMLLAIPTAYVKYLFSPLMTVVVGTVFPIYESIRAVCTPDEDDDKLWLQYWMVGGVLFMGTEWVTHVIQKESALTAWYTSTTFFYFWLFYPLTDGAMLIYHHITKPLLGPRIKQLEAKMNNALTAIYQLMVNAVHLWLLWILFMFLPSRLKRILSILIGTLYPLVCSIAAAGTDEVADDTYWLTYWSVYGCLYLIMTALETYIGWIPGFYTLVILATVYLMLPMFYGADKLFRRVLVPLAGLQELLLLRDAIQMKKQILLDLHPDRQKAVRKAIAKFYADDDAMTVERVDLPEEMKKEYISMWKTIRLPSNPFGKRSANTKPTTTTTTTHSETTPLV